MPQTDHLQTDCSKCAALCCVVLTFDKGKDFAFSKNPGEPCRNLSGHKCSVHDTLSQDGLGGCVAYDCLGAGNRVVQEVFSGQTWQKEPRLTRVMMEAFSGMCEVHKRIDLLRAVETQLQNSQDLQTCQNFRTSLEERRWSGPELNEFEVELGLEIDIFIHGIKDNLSEELRREI